jgi:SAM-dependent methyltransferase
MMNRPHSADYFGPQRDFWWNADFLDLMARRWRLGEVRRVLDVGCGVGHWAHQILPRCHPEATLLGIDREAEWIAEARACATPRATFENGDATALDRFGGGFDLVTCQTVLIHLAEPARAVAHMAAQLAPGGLLAIVEPNNLAQALVADSLDADVPMVERAARLRFQWLCEMGKRNLGLGDNSIGDRVPEFFARAGLTDIQVYTSDKVPVIAPPYPSPHERALRAEAFEHEERNFAGWDCETARQYFVAGGGDEAAFDAEWRRERARVVAIAAAYREERYSASFGGVFYLVSGRRA